MTSINQPVTIDLEGHGPLTVTVVAMERRQEPGIFDIRLGLDAQVHVQYQPGDQPNHYFLSMLVDESHWIIDAHIGPKGQVYFSHGFGSRVTELMPVVPELADLLDQAARRGGLVLAIGRGVPLVLAEPGGTEPRVV